MNTKKFEEKKRQVSGKYIVGVDPGMDKHDMTVIDIEGNKIGRSFTVPVNYEGFAEKVFNKLYHLIGDHDRTEVVFAVESACNLWQTLCDWLYREGYKVVMVLPLTTRCSRPLLNHDFSKTDPKDSYLVGVNAQRGHYDDYKVYSPWIENMRRLSITWSKLATDRVRNLQRIRAFMNNWFPEYNKVFKDISVETSLYLIERYFLPQHFDKSIIMKEVGAVRRISRGNYGKEKLVDLAAHSGKSIGVECSPEEEETLRIILDGWISELRTVNLQMERVNANLIELAKSSRNFEILVSLMGVSDFSAARFIAECRDFEGVRHYGQIERFAGLNVRVSDSGRGSGARHINGIGNKRLNHILNQMTEQVVRYIPEVGNKYMRRQLKKPCFRKNIIACIPKFLKLVVALMRDGRPYEFEEEALKEMAELKKQYDVVKKKRKWKSIKFAA